MSTLIAAGCGRSSSGEADEGPGAITVSAEDPVDFSEVAKAFETSTAAMKFSVNEVLAVIRSGAFADARMQLVKFANDPRLTAEQKQALENLAAKLQPLSNRQR